MPPLFRRSTDTQPNCRKVKIDNKLLTPTILGSIYPRYSFVFLQNSQDLAPIGHNQKNFLFRLDFGHACARIPPHSKMAAGGQKYIEPLGELMCSAGIFKASHFDDSRRIRSASTRSTAHAAPSCSPSSAFLIKPRVSTIP